MKRLVLVLCLALLLPACAPSVNRDGTPTTAGQQVVAVEVTSYNAAAAGYLVYLNGSPTRAVMALVTPKWRAASKAVDEAAAAPNNPVLQVLAASATAAFVEVLATHKIPVK